MRQVVVAFDVDGCILNNENIIASTPAYLRPPEGVNIEVILLIQILKKKIKNSRIIVWSGGGKDYATQIVERYGLGKYVDACYGKKEYEPELDGHVDIAFDDIHEFEMADKNLIVRMK